MANPQAFSVSLIADSVVTSAKIQEGAIKFRRIGRKDVMHDDGTKWDDSIGVRLAHPFPKGDITAVYADNISNLHPFNLQFLEESCL